MTNTLLAALVADKPVKVIAAELGKTENYIHQCLHRLRRAAGVRTNWGLVAKYLRGEVCPTADAAKYH